MRLDEARRIIRESWADPEDLLESGVENDLTRAYDLVTHVDAESFEQVRRLVQKYRRKLNAGALVLGDSGADFVTWKFVDTSGFSWNMREDVSWRVGMVSGPGGYGGATVYHEAHHTEVQA